MICCHGLMHCRTIAENKTHNNDHAPLTRGAVVKVRVVNRLRSLQGQGVAGKLVQAAVDDIKSMGGEVRATCSYAVKWLEKHGE